MTRFLKIQDVIEIHDCLVQDFSGRLGIRDFGLLSSAIEMPKAQMAGAFLHESVFDQASAYLFHLCQNHPFIDGNKRTAAISSLVFLEDNKIFLNFDEIQFEKMTVETASGKISKQEIAHALKKWKI
ncbi:MAG: type II toxin-antitoxin system death-on-curing family toxin [Simkaniaceae bacterium]|nr:type II toxin-antitoxin system death-on-curing family toxin [Candidatus Sacchlamyda saccharinae]